MAFASLLIGTGILWLLKTLVVVPLSCFLTQQQMARPPYAHLNDPNCGEAEQAALERLVARNYIIADVLVLGIAGFIAGLLGYWFIGIAWNRREWPGLIAFVVASLLGLSLASG